MRRYKSNSASAQTVIPSTTTTWAGSRASFGNKEATDQKKEHNKQQSFETIGINVRINTPHHDDGYVNEGSARRERPAIIHVLIEIEQAP